MTEYQKCLLVLALFAIVLSCNTKFEEQDSTRYSFNLLTKGACSVDSSFLVTEADIANYIKRIELARNRKCLGIQQVFHSDYPVSYVLNYDSGWEIISADKRGPHLLASAEEGSFDMENLPPAISAWMTKLYDEIALRWSMALPLDTSNEDEILSVAFWEHISNPDPQNTRSDPGGPLMELVLLSTDIYPQYYSQVPHLTTTTWHQDYPYNHACPFIDTTLSVRAPAGCTPVAGAQMLYYLHYYWGIPEYGPSYAYSYSILPNQAIFSSGPVTTTIWDQMNNNDTLALNKAYTLIADIGRLANASYSNTGTGAGLDDLILAMEQYGLSGVLSTYNADTVVNSLMRSVPTITDAYRYDYAGNEYGHTFLIDGYQMYRDSIVDTYILTYPNGSHIPVLEPEPFQVVYYYTSPYIRYFKMNWGWGDYWNYGIYALYGTWEVNGKSYDRYFNMIHSIIIDE